MTTIIDDFIDTQLQDAIEKNLLSSTFNWYYNSSTINYNEGPGEIFKKIGIDSHQFCHPVEIGGEIFNHLTPIFENISKHFKSDIKILRIKFNLLNKLESKEHNYPHIDTTDNEFISLIYYVNDSDGDTIIFKEQYPTDAINLSIETQCTPKKGRAIFFDSTTYHASSSPHNNNVRVILNIIFKLTKEK